MTARNLNVARMDIVPSASDNTLMQTFASAAQANGEHVILMLDLNWVVTSDAYTFLSNNQTTIYNTAYSAVYNFVLPMRTYTNIDWELGNEIDLKTANLATSPSNWNSGWTAANWANFSAYGSSDYYGNWAAAVKGAADAIAAINSQYGTTMRRVLNTTSTHTGFLDYMTSKGVGYEVISYHYYQYSGTSPSDLSAEPPGATSYNWNLFSALAAYNLPVTIDEMNCAEIYESNFQNLATDPLYATCLTNLRTQIGYFKNNTILKIESLVAYELLDEPSQAAPENHFGLFWNDGSGNYTPKANLYLWGDFAGGSLSASEQSVLSSFGLLPLP
jgi:hypothetical protein